MRLDDKSLFYHVPIDSESWLDEVTGCSINTFYYFYTLVYLHLLTLSRCKFDVDEEVPSDTENLLEEKSMWLDIGYPYYIFIVGKPCFKNMGSLDRNYNRLYKELMLNNSLIAFQRVTWAYRCSWPSGFGYIPTKSTFCHLEYNI